MSEFEVTCATYAEDLSALLDGELAEPREVEVLRHLESTKMTPKRSGRWEHGAS